MNRPLHRLLAVSALLAAARPARARADHELAPAPDPALAPEVVKLVQSSSEAGAQMRYRANRAGGDCGLAWTTPKFDDGGWSAGEYGAGFGAGLKQAASSDDEEGAMIETAVPAGSRSLYTRAWFNLADPGQVGRLFVGADYGGGYILWINGVEVYRSPEMAPGRPCTATAPAAPRAPAGRSTPDYGKARDITALAAPHLHAGFNLAAIGVWAGENAGSLLIAPRIYYEPAAPEAADAVTRGPYLQSGTTTGVIVRWRTNNSINSRVRYGTDPASLTLFADVTAPSTEHVVPLAGLAPDTTYYYSVGTTAGPLAPTTVDATYRFRTAPPAGTARPFRFWVIGDSGTATTNQASVRDKFVAYTGARDPDAWLMLGDNAYSNGTDTDYQNGVFNMYPAQLRKWILWSCYGNHDSYSANSSTQSGPYYDLFSFPKNGEAGGVASGSESYYSFNYGNVHFISLDAMDSAFRSPSGAQMTWLQQDLAAVTQPWIIVFWHHPPYSKGSHDSDTEIELMEMRANFLPVLEQAGVDLVLGGHSHSYERSFLIDGHYGDSTTWSATYCKDCGSGRPAGTGAYKKPTLGKAPHEGAVYAVAGSSGQTSGGLLNHPAMYISLNTLGSMVIDVNGGRLDATFLTGAGTVADSFTLLKGAAAPRAVPDGKFVAGTPMKSAKNAADGSRLAVTWDAAGCRTSTQYQILWGKGGDLPTMTPSGAACNVGQSGSYAWDAAPAVPAGQSFIWWTVVGTDGATQESSWGKNSAGAEEHGTAASGQCAITAKNTANACP